MTASVETSSVFFSVMEHKVEQLFIVRKEIGAVPKHRLFQGLKDGAMNILRGGKDAIRRRASKDVSKDDPETISGLKGKDFKAICKAVLDHLGDINRDFKECVPESDLQSLILKLNNMELLISFHGLCNVGKSTILNAFLRKQILPASRTPETGVALHIRFVNRCEMESISTTEEVILKDKDEVIATGITPIKEKLVEINKSSREFPDSYTSRRFCLFMECPFEVKMPTGWKYTIIDSPGGNEYNRDLIKSVVQKSYDASLAYIFVLTVTNYQNSESCRHLKFLYNSNKDIFKQGQLTIVINKLDEALFPPPFEESRSSDEVIREVKNYLCEKVLLCSCDDLPDNALIPVCGQWALIAHLFQKSRMNEISSEGQCSREDHKQQQKLEMYLQKVAHEFKSYPEHSELDETDSDTLATLIVEQSGITKVEKRFEQITRNSVSLWKLKLSEHILRKMNFFAKLLSRQRETLSRSISDMKGKIHQIGDVMDKMAIVYSGIIRASNNCDNGSDFWKAIESACKEDMQGDEIREFCLKECSKQLDTFKLQTIEKLGVSQVQLQEFKEDLKKTKAYLSAAMDNYMSSRIYFKKTYEEYHQKYSEILTQISEVFKYAQDNLEDVPAINITIISSDDLPVLAGPSVAFLSVTSIPEGQPNILDLILMTLEKLLPELNDSGESCSEDSFHKSVEDENIEHKVSDESFNKFGMGAAVKTNATELCQDAPESAADLTPIYEDNQQAVSSEKQLSTSISDPEHEHPQDGQVYCIPVSKETIEPYSSNGDYSLCNSGLQRSDLSSRSYKITTSTAKKEEFTQLKNERKHHFKRLTQVGYKHWSSDLENLIQNLKDKANEEISAFFDDIGTNIVKIFCDDYKTKILLLLKNFDSSMKNTLWKEKERFDKMMKELQHLEDRHQACCHHIEDLRKLSENFRSAIPNFHSEAFP